MNFSKVLLFSDLHVGKGKDNPIKMGTLSRTVDWIIETAKKNTVTTAFFLGDYFDSRQAISPLAIELAYQTLNKFREAGISLYIIVGNHDLYYKENQEIHSLQFFREFSNVTLIEKTYSFTLGDKTGIALAWNNLPDTKASPADIVFMHGNFKGAKLCGSISDVGLDNTQLAAIGKKIYAGHYHLRNEYSFENCDMVTVGNPFEMDFSDYHNTKGIHILTEISCTFIENPVAPKHIKVYWSDIVAKNMESLAKVQGNYVKLIVDTEKYTYDDVLKVVKFINGKKPLTPCETEFLYSNSVKQLAKENSESLKNYEEFMAQSVLEQISTFVEMQSKDENSLINKLGLDKGKVKKTIEEIYTEHLTKKGK